MEITTAMNEKQINALIATLVNLPWEDARNLAVELDVLAYGDGHKFRDSRELQNRAKAAKRDYRL